jgi:hypothetical protein
MAKKYHKKIVKILWVSGAGVHVLPNWLPSTRVVFNVTIELKGTEYINNP